MGWHSYIKCAALIQCEKRSIVCVENPFVVIVVVENIFVDHTDCSAIVVPRTSFMYSVSVNTLPAASVHFDLTAEGCVLTRAK